jgi:hypothetical protein
VRAVRLVLGGPTATRLGRLAARLTRTARLGLAARCGLGHQRLLASSPASQLARRPLLGLGHKNQRLGCLFSPACSSSHSPASISSIGRDSTAQRGSVKEALPGCSHGDGAPVVGFVEVRLLSLLGFGVHLFFSSFDSSRNQNFLFLFLPQLDLHARSRRLIPMLEL